MYEENARQMIVNVFLLQSAGEYDTEYSYLVDGTLAGAIVRGSFVMVPFGIRDTEREAVVWSVQACTAVSRPLKRILSQIDWYEPLEAEAMTLCERIREKYFCTMGEAVKCLLPPAVRKGTQVRFAVLAEPQEKIARLIASGAFRNMKQIRLLELLAEAPEGMPVEEAARMAGCGTGVAETLAKNGHLLIEKRRMRKEQPAALPQTGLPTYERHMLNPGQQQAYDTVVRLLARRRFAECLLHGVTGSGKTEVYMQLISHVLSWGGNAVMLVPEISLTPQMTAHFTARFGDRVAVLHSGLSSGSRNAQWHRIRSGAVSVVLGARSAVFAPFREIALFILDEEQEHSYLSEDMMPRYHAAEIARMRADMMGAVVLYGSATPGIDTFYRAASGQIAYLRLSQRAGTGRLPEICLTDMREERYAGCDSLFSRGLQEAMRENAAQGGQTILFVHRRGFSRQIVCRACGRTMKCGRCNIPMTCHAASGRLICHYCGNTVLTPERCPACGSNDLERRGCGTERVEEALSALFPGQEVLRMDTDTTAEKGGHAKILKQFSDGRAAFLVGTQMIAKGHDFPGVTLVGVLSADSLLNMPDYRASERAFQLLTQVAGRAGRGDRAGRVILQAYNIDDYAITAAAHQDYGEFYQNEIVVRENLWYPPFCSMYMLRCSGEDDKAVFSHCRTCLDMLRTAAAQLTAEQPCRIELLGPTREDMPKVNGRYRWRLLAKAENEEVLHRLFQRFAADYKRKKNIRTAIIVHC